MKLQNMLIMPLGDKGFDRLPYKGIKEALGVADTNRNIAYVRMTPDYAENKDTVMHEIGELMDDVSYHETPDEPGIRYKKKWYSSITRPFGKEGILNPNNFIQSVIDVPKDIFTGNWSDLPGDLLNVTPALIPFLPELLPFLGSVGAEMGSGLGTVGSGLMEMLGMGGTAGAAGGGSGNILQSIGKLFGMGGGNAGGMPAGISAQDWARLSPQTQQSMLQQYGSASSGSGGGIMDVISKLFGGGGTSTGTTGGSNNWLTQLLPQLFSTFGSSYLQSKQNTEQKNYLEDLMAPYKQTAEQLGGVVRTQLNEPLQLPQSYWDKIWNTSRERTANEFAPVYQKTTERAAGSGMLGQGPTNQLFTDIDVSKAKTLEQQATDQALSEWNAKLTANQNAINNAMNYVGRAGSAVNYAVPPTKTDYSGLTNLGLKLADLWKPKNTFELSPSMFAAS